jgi:signal transduction histidine kinase
MDQLDQKTIPLSLQSCDVLALINEICTKKNYTAYLAIHTDPESLDYVVSADKFLLKSILSNLIDNAIKYTKPESMIDIRLSQSIAPLGVSKRTSSAESGILIAIENHPGPAGFPDLKKVFTKFYRAPETHSKIGSGLGLYLVKGMCEKINAYIHYVPLTKLVRFELWLPR